MLAPLQERVASIVAGLAADARLFPAYLAAVEARDGLDRLFQLAAEKDRGFTSEMFAEMASRFSRLRIDEFDIDAEEYEELARRVDGWREQALDR